MARATDRPRPHNTETIATFLNRYLKPQGKMAQVAQHGTRLQILLEGIDLPEHEHMVPWVTQAIETLQPDQLEMLQVYGRRAGEKNCQWMESFALRSGQLVPLDSMSMAHTIYGEGDLIAQSREGNISAIGIFVDRALDNPSLRSHVALDRGVLQIVIETIQFLDGQHFAVELAQKLMPIASPKVQYVEIYQRKTATAKPCLLNRIQILNRANHRLNTPS